MVTSSLMQMLTARGLFSGLPSEDPHAHIAKVRAVCKSCVGRPDLDLDVIGLRVFPLSLTGEAAMWFTDLPYNSIFTWNQLRDVFLARYYLVSKKLNHKDKVNNFVALPRESLSSSWDRFTSFLRSVQNHAFGSTDLATDRRGHEGPSWTPSSHTYAISSASLFITLDGKYDGPS